MIRKKIIIGTRLSCLAMAQAKSVLAELKKMFPKYSFSLKGIVTKGDRLKKMPKKLTKGLFVKEIEKALIKKKIDIAVHSMKDLPIEMPEVLEIAAITRRIDYRDVLISKNAKKLAHLKKGAVVGTSSPRRKMQILLLRPDLVIKDIRGNIDTRIKKLKQGNFDAIILAAAGILRLGLKDLITEYLPCRVMLPACGQGSLGIQVRKKDIQMRRIAKKINHQKSNIEITAEKEFLKTMGGGCRVPFAALAQVQGGKFTIIGIAASDKNKIVVKDKISSAPKYFKLNARKLANQIKQNLLSKKNEKNKGKSIFSRSGAGR
ncbi:MAG: hydroxymethylbilane synthase [Candidatus Omnitrophota bacterium]